MPVFYGNTHKYIDGKKITLFDGGGLYNPYIPSNIEYPLIYSSFCNTINYQKVVSFLQKPVDVVSEIADVIITTPVGGTIITGSNKVVEDLVEAGYQKTKKLLYK